MLEQGMESPVFLLIAGFIVLGFSGEALLRGAVTLAAGLRVPPMIIGLTIIAFGTSAPELTVSLNAALSGQPDISVGNVVGSNIANILLVLGTMATVSPFIVHQGTWGRDGGFMLAMSFMLLVFGLFGAIVALVGAFLLMILLFYTVYLYSASRSLGNAEGSAEGNAEGNAEGEAAASVDENLLPGGMMLALPVLLAAIAGVIWGAELMVDGAVGLARQWGIAEAVIALSIVAVGTSLPELAVSLVAARRGHAGLAVGNIIGSNISNILLILGTTAVVAPLPIAETLALRDIPIMCAVALLGLLFMASGRQMSRREGIFCLVLYGGYMGFIFNA